MLGAMLAPNPNRRSKQRQRTLKEGRIIFNSRRSVISCVVRNLSERGALLIVPHIAGIPPTFDFCVGNETHAARIVWADKDKLGITWD